MKTLIAVAGLARTGKDTVANHLIETHGFTKYAFADPVRTAVCAIFGVPMSVFEPWTKEKVIPRWGLSPRQMMQKVATDCCRDVIDPQLWVKRAEDWWQDINSDKWNLFGNCNGVVISDLRHENEADFVRANGGRVWHLDRPDAEAVNDHISEAGIQRKKSDLIINNDTSLEALLAMTTAALAC